MEDTRGGWLMAFRIHLLYLYSESKKPRDSTRLTQEIKVNMDGIADSLLKPDYHYCFLVKIRVILWFAKQIPSFDNRTQMNADNQDF